MEGGQDYFLQVKRRNIHISGSVNALANVQSLERKHRKICAWMKASSKTEYKTGNKGQATLYENLNANLWSTNIELYKIMLTKTLKWHWNLMTVAPPTHLDRCLNSSGQISLSLSWATPTLEKLSLEKSYMAWCCIQSIVYFSRQSVNVSSK